MVIEQQRMVDKQERRQAVMIRDAILCYMRFSV